MSLLKTGVQTRAKVDNRTQRRIICPSKSSTAPRSRKRVVMNLFTGIVQGLATVSKVTRKQDFSELELEFPKGAVDGVKMGASVAINGTCLSVTAQNDDKLSFDVMKETLRATNLGELDAGSRCNFERSARVGDEIGGHLVSGHVSCRAQIVRKEVTPNNTRLTFALEDPKFIRYILPKGFVSIDGCSLTVGEVNDPESPVASSSVDPFAGVPSASPASPEIPRGSGGVSRDRAWFTVYLIPDTLSRTVFGFKSKGESVNIEIDAHTQAIVDTVARVLERRGLGSGSSDVHASI